MTANSLSDALHEAYVQARDMDASLDERLETFSNVARALRPEAQAAVDRMVERLKAHRAGDGAPRRRSAPANRRCGRAISASASSPGG